MRPTIFGSLSLLLIILLSFSCGSDEKDWEKAKSSNTIFSYNEYLRIHPTGTYIDSAKSKIEEHQWFELVKSKNNFPAYQLFLAKFPQSSFSDSIQFWTEQFYNKRHPDFRYARTVKITDNLYFEKTEKTTLGYERIAEGLFYFAGLRLLKDESEEADVTLQIDGRGKALSASYWSVGRQYTGAELSGTISFNTSKGFIYKERFEGRRDPGSFTNTYSFGGRTKLGTRSKPFSAPWFYVAQMQGSFYDKFFDMISNIFECPTLIFLLSDSTFGEMIRDKMKEIKDPNTIEPLLNIVKYYKSKDLRTFQQISEDTQVVRYALDILCELKEPKVVEPLIYAMEGKRHNVKDIIAESLKKITQEDFGGNEEKWKKWWEGNKDNFLVNN